MPLPNVTAGTPTALTLGYWNTLTDTQIAHPNSATNAIINLNDGITWSLLDTGNGLGEGLEWGPLSPNIFDAGNPRTPGRILTRRNYGDARTLRVHLLLGQFSNYASFITALRNLTQTLEGITPQLPGALKIQPVQSSAPVYVDILEGHLLDNYRETLWNQLLDDGITVEFTCRPFLRGARQLLQNLAPNPGFEAPGAVSVQVFNDPLTNLNAYSPQQYSTAVQTDTPVRYYRMQEVAGTSAIDAGSQLTNGTYNGGFTLAQVGALGGSSLAVLYNGSTGYLSAVGTSLPSGNSAFSVETLLFFTANPGGTVDVMVMGTASTNQAILVQLNSTGHIVTLFQGGSSVTSTAALSTNVWHHVAVTWNGTTLTLYVDGASTGTPITPGAANITLGSFTAAAALGGGSYLSGRLEEVAIYSTALSAARVTAHSNAGVPEALVQDVFNYADAVLADLPFRYYRLDEPVGSNAFDAAYSNQTGTYHTGINLNQSSGLTGSSDASILCNGTTGYVGIPTTSLPSGNNNWSLEGWFNLQATGANQFIWDIGSNSSYQGAQLYVNNTNHLTGGFNSHSISAAGTVGTAAWHHAVVTYDGTNVNLYMDGSLVAGPTALGPGNITFGTASIGQQLSFGGNFFNGYLDECAIYGVALSSARVTAHYNAGHNTPSATANTMQVPVGASARFGSTAWGPLNLWQIRWRYRFNLGAYFTLHQVDANNYLAVLCTGALSSGTLSIIQVIAGVTHTVGSVACGFFNEVWTWLTVTQFPTVQGSVTTLQATVSHDTAGTIGTTISTLEAQTFDAVTALSGYVELTATGATLGVGGNFTNVHTLSLFGPGGWLVTCTSAGSTGVVSGAWDSNTANTYTAAPVTSTYAARLDMAPAGTADGYWYIFGGGVTPIGTFAMPVSVASSVIYCSAYTKGSGMGSGSTTQLILREYDASGNFLRQTTLQTLTGNQSSWTLISGHQAIGASTAYLDIVLGVVDNTVGSASGTVWFDNVQVWNSTTTGETTMPYCELRFPQSPSQLLVTGILGDVAAPAEIAFGTFLSSWAPTSTLSFVFGRAARAMSTPFLVSATALDTSSSYVSFVNSTVWGGNYVGTNGAGPGINVSPPAFVTASNKGTFHLWVRYFTNQTGGNLGNISARPIALLSITGTPASAAYYGQYTYPITQANAWNVVDVGYVQIPPASLGGMVDPTITSITLYAEMVDSTGGGATQSANWWCLVPVDGAVITGVVNNPSNATITLTNQWLFLYTDGSAVTAGLQPGWGISYAPTALSNPANGYSVSGTATTGFINLNPVSDPYISLDPTQRINGVSVNHIAGFITDGPGDVLAVACDIAYTPLYLYPQ